MTKQTATELLQALLNLANDAVAVYELHGALFVCNCDKCTSLRAALLQYMELTEGRHD